MPSASVCLIGASLTNRVYYTLSCSAEWPQRWRRFKCSLVNKTQVAINFYRNFTLLWKLVVTSYTFRHFRHFCLHLFSWRHIFMFPTFLFTYFIQQLSVFSDFTTSLEYHNYLLKVTQIIKSSFEHRHGLYEFKLCPMLLEELLCIDITVYCFSITHKQIILAKESGLNLAKLELLNSYLLKRANKNFEPTTIVSCIWIL